MLNILIIIVGAVYTHFTLLANLETKYSEYREKDKTVYVNTFATKESVGFVKEKLQEVGEDVKIMKDNTSRDLQDIKRMLAKR